MHLKGEIHKANEHELLVVAQLASAYTLLAEAPYDSWSHEGSPAEMAVWVVMDAKKQGRLGFVERIVLGEKWRVEAQR